MARRHCDATACACSPTNEQILNGALNETNKNPCKSDAVLSKHRPCAVYLNNDTTGVLGCGWGTLNTALRIVFSLLSVGICGLVFVLVFWKKKGGAYFISLLMLLGAAGFIYLAYLDVSDVDASRKWCKDKMKGTHFFRTPSDVKCLYSKFIGTTVTEPFAALFFIIATAMGIVYTHNTRMVKSKLDTNSVDFDMPSRDIGPRHEDEEDGDEDGRPTLRAAESDESGVVNFDEEQSKRFTPMSKTEIQESKTLQQQARSSQTKDYKHSVAPVAPGQIDFDAEAASDDETSQPSAPSYLRTTQPSPSAPPAPPHPAKHTPPAHAPPTRAPPTSPGATKRAPTAPPPTKSGVVDFDAIAEEP